MGRGVVYWVGDMQAGCSLCSSVYALARPLGEQYLQDVKWLDPAVAGAGNLCCDCQYAGWLEGREGTPKSYI